MRKLVTVQVTSNGRKLTLLTMGEVDPRTGTTRVPEKIIHRMLTALGVQKGQTYTIGA